MFCALVSLDLTSDDGTIALFQTGTRRPTLSHGKPGDDEGAWSIACAINVKIKTAKISSGGETGFLRKF